MSPEEQAALDDFQGDPDEMPIGWLILCGALLLVALVPLVPFAVRWLAGQS